MRYRKKPVVIEAVQWNGDKFVLPAGDPIYPAWLSDALAKRPGEKGAIVRIGAYLHTYTLEGMHTASPGDWIIQGVASEIYPCKPDIFAATYEHVE